MARHFHVLLSLISIFMMAAAQAATTASPVPQCPLDPRVEDIPDLLFTFESFDEEAFAKDLAALKQHLPEWIEKKSTRLPKGGPADTQAKIFDGELWMAYTNTLNGVEGYILKLEYLTADEATRPEKKKHSAISSEKIL